MPGLDELVKNQLTAETAETAESNIGILGDLCELCGDVSYFSAGSWGHQ